MAHPNNQGDAQARGKQAISAVPRAYRVGEKLHDSSGTEWVVAKIWRWPRWNDYGLINTKTGVWGTLRQDKVITAASPDSDTSTKAEKNATNPS